MAVRHNHMLHAPDDGGGAGAEAPAADAPAEAAPEPPSVPDQSYSGSAGPIVGPEDGDQGGGDPQPRDPQGRFDDADFNSLGSLYDRLLAEGGETVAVPAEVLSRLRNEHQKYRERWGPIEKNLGHLVPEDREAFMQFARDIADDEARPQAVEWMRGVLETLSPAQQAQVVQAIAEQQAEGGEEDFDPFDPANIDKRVESLLDRRLQEREQKAAEEAQQAAIQSRARELGYTDPTDPQYATLLFVAKQYLGDPDPLGRAHEAIEQKLNDRAFELLKAKRADAQQPTAPQDGVAPSGHKAPLTMEDAANSARERLDRILQGPLAQT